MTSRTVLQRFKGMRIGRLALRAKRLFWPARPVQRSRSPGPAVWVAHMAELFRREIAPELERSPPSRGETVYFWTPQGRWAHVIIEYLLATALRLRGYDVRFFVCDGGLAHCEMERQLRPRPSCESCWKSTRRMLDAFRLPYDCLSASLSREQLDAIAFRINVMADAELELVVRNRIALGKYSREYLTTYFNGAIAEYGPYESSAFRRILAGNLAAQIFAEWVLHKYDPGIVMMINGHFCQSFPAYHVFRNAGARLIAWDDFGIFTDGFLLQQNKPATDGSISDEAWATARETPLSSPEEAQVDRFLRDWPVGRVNDLVLQGDVESDPEVIARRLNLDLERRVCVAYSNIVWDSAALGKNVGFADMTDWLYCLCDWFVEHPREQLVVRVHPGERRLTAHLTTVRGVAGQVRERYGDLLERGNIRVVDAEDDISSYALAEIAQAVAVYTSTIAMEVATRGRRAWVSGQVHYRDKGFTIDVMDRDHLYQMLEQEPWDSGGTEESRALARRYIHARVSRQVTRVPFLPRDNCFYLRRPYFESLQFLRPGCDPLFDTLAERVLDGKPFLDVPRECAARFEMRPA